MGASRLQALVAHRLALVTITSQLMGDRTGGVLAGALEVLDSCLKLRGALAYRVQAGALILVSDLRLPATARSSFSQLSLSDEPFFIAQRVALSLKHESESPSSALDGVGWNHLAATPLLVGRTLHGVIVVASDRPIFDSDTQTLLDTVAGILTLALEREAAAERERERLHGDTRAAELATMGLLSSSTLLDVALPLSALGLELEEQERTVATLRTKLELALGCEAVEGLEELEAIHGRIEAMEDNLRRAQRVASGMLAVARRTRAETVDLVQALGDCLTLTRSAIDGRGICLEMEGDDEPALVEGRRESLSMLLIQLVLHSVEQARGSRPRLRVRMLRGHHEHRVSFEVSGSGAGPTSSQGGGPRRRWLDAFLGKERREARAPGLALARQTAVAHHGHIEVGTSELGGPVHVVVLPASTLPQTPRGRASSLPPPRAVILCISEETDLAFELSATLPDVDVMCALSVCEARTLIATLDPPPTLVLCDVVLPDGDCLDVHSAVDAELARRFAFVTAGVIDADTASYLRESSCATLIQPVTSAEVQKLLTDDTLPVGPSPIPEAPPHDTLPPFMSRPFRRWRTPSPSRPRRITLGETPQAKSKSPRTPR
jgi:hypothetical protein